MTVFVHPKTRREFRAYYLQELDRWVVPRVTWAYPFDAETTEEALADLVKPQAMQKYERKEG